MELLLTVAAARRAGANNVTTVIPYFGYKYHRRGLPISTTYHSRFLWSAAGDLAKMLQAVGVDNVISVDLQRPGQGHEACFFDSSIPVETVSANDIFVDYFKNKIHPPLKKVVVVSANTECVKKARKFQRKLKASTGLEDVEYAVFMRAEDTQWGGNAAGRGSELLGDVKGADVIIIDDVVGGHLLCKCLIAVYSTFVNFTFDRYSHPCEQLIYSSFMLYVNRQHYSFLGIYLFYFIFQSIETAAQLSVLCRRIVREGAGRVFICASHGLFTKNSMELIDLSPVEKVVVTDSVPLPAKHSPKIDQVPEKAIQTCYSSIIIFLISLRVRP
jgi:phosphoribosylpyrophosphate synthetase